MSIPPNEYLKMLQGLNQPMPERNFTPGPGMGPVAMPQPVQEVYLDEYPQPPVIAQAPVMAPPMPPVQQPVSPLGLSALEKNLLESGALQQRGAVGLAKIQRDMAADQEKILNAQADFLKAEREAAATRAEQQRTAIEQPLNKLNEINESLRSANYDGFWAKRSTPQKIGAALAIGLGALGASMQGGGQNYAMDIINKAMDDDFRSWQANVDQKNKAFLAQRQYIGDLKDTFRTREEQALAQKVLYLEGVNTQLQSIAAKQKGLEATPNFEMMQGKLMDERAATILNLSKLRAETIKAEREAAGSTGPGIVQALQAVPKEFQSEAYKELKSVTEYNKVQEDVISAFKDASQFSISAGIPGFLGGNKEAYEAWVAKISGAIVGKVPGIKSDQDFRAIVRPMLPSWTDTNAVAQAKTQNMMGFLRSQAPNAPILESYGYNLAPQFQEQKPQQQQKITPALQAQAQAQLQAANQKLVQNPNDEQAKQVRDRALLILGQ